MQWKRISFLSLTVILLLNLFPFTVFGAEATAESSATGAATIRLYGKDRIPARVDDLGNRHSQ